MGLCIKIAAVDDHPVYLRELASTLGRVPGFHVVAKGSTAADACRIHSDFRPDVLVLDLDIPGDGAAAALAITQEDPSAKVLILTASADYAHMQSALKNGAIGLLHKGVAPEIVASAIKCVHAGISLTAC